MQILQHIDPGNALVAALACVCLCGLGIVLVTGFHVLTGLIGAIGSVLQLFFQILGGGPVAWCGCLVVILIVAGGIGLVIVMAQAFSTCGTPQAINFCSLLGQ